MNRKLNLFSRFLNFFLLFVPLLSACERGALPLAPDISRADGLMEAAYQARDYNRLLSLADSLEATRDLSPVKANYWRGYAYSRQRNYRASEDVWNRALSAGLRDEDDILYQASVANRLSDQLLLQGEYAASLRVALPTIEKMENAGLRENGDYAHLLSTVGCCELHLGHMDEAVSLFDRAYNQFMPIIGTEKGKVLSNFTNIISGVITVIDHCLEQKQYTMALEGVGILQQLLKGYQGQEGASPDYLDRQGARILLYRACALEGLGRRQEAAEAYDEALRSAYAKTDEGKMEANGYLMLAGRWEEAADNYQLMDKLVRRFNMNLTLDNISHYLLPRFRANYNANRMEAALAAGARLCDVLDSAIIWNREDKAAELSTIYHTQEIEQEVLTQKANNERERYLASIMVLVLLVISFGTFIIVRYRSSMRLEQAYQQLEEANARAEESSRVKTAFIQQISHEIRTPLNLLSGFAQILTNPDVEMDEESLAQINSGILANTGRITSLISKILDLSDLMSHSKMQMSDTAPVREIASEAAASSGILSAREIDFQTQVADEAQSLEVTTNRRAAAHVLALLLENAAKYTEKGRVSLKIVPKNHFVYFIVEDTGIGIPPKEAEHIFEQFVQLDDYREGTGIGLSVARSITRRLGGDIVLDTSYTNGARFLFSLPKDA